MNKLITEKQNANNALIPTTEEKDLNTKLADIRNQANLAKQDVKEYESKLPGEGISQGGIDARSYNVEKAANLTLERLGIEEANLLTRLGLAQDARTIQQKIADGNYNAQKDALDYKFKIQDAIDKQKTDLANAAEKLTDNARSALTTILTQFDGLTYHALSPDGQNQLMTLAKTAGIPIDTIIKGMDVVKAQKDFDNLQKNKASVSAETKKTADWNKANQFITDNPDATADELKLALRQNTNLSDGDINQLVDTKKPESKQEVFLSDQNIKDTAIALVKGYSSNLQDAKNAIKTGKLQVNGKMVNLTPDQVDKISKEIDTQYPNGRTFWEKVLPWGK